MTSGEKGFIKFNYLGVAVLSIEEALPFYERFFGYRIISDLFHDPIQQVFVCLIDLQEHSHVKIELLQPCEDYLPISRVQSKGIGAYYLCLEVQDIDYSLSQARLHRCITPSNPVPAVALNRSLIVWFYIRLIRQLVGMLA
ncbi:MAG: VOC family protein [Ktedonobacteraceae bacterium]